MSGVGVGKPRIEGVPKKDKIVAAGWRSNNGVVISIAKKEVERAYAKRTKVVIDGRTILVWTNNTENTAKLTVDKRVINATADGSFDLLVGVTPAEGKAVAISLLRTGVQADPDC